MHGDVMMREKNCERSIKALNVQVQKSVE